MKTTNESIRPRFFVVGAQKAGTSTLHEWLKRQSDVVLPKLKETHYFSDDKKYEQGIIWYLDQFPKHSGDSVIGEIDPDYLFYSESPCRIREHVDRPRFVFILRHPIDRAYSHYLMSVRRGYEALSFEDALYHEEARRNQFPAIYMAHHSYLSRGMYCEQILRYLSLFPKSDCLFVKFDDLFSSNTGSDIYAQICRFIGVNTPPVPPDYAMKKNQSSRPRFTFIRDLIYGASSVRKVTRILFPFPSIKLKLAMQLDKLNQIPNEKSSESCLSAIPRQINDIVNNEIDKLTILTGLDTSEWLKRYP